MNKNFSLHAFISQAEANFPSEQALDLANYAQKLYWQGLPVILSLRHLSQLTQVDPFSLSRIIFRDKTFNSYSVFAITKRSGDLRFIHARTNTLFKIQRYINRRFLSRLVPHHSSFAYYYKRNTLQCVSHHLGAKTILKYDLKDFFFHINEKNIYDIFLSLGYSKAVSFYLARLCTTTKLPRELIAYVREAPYQQEFSRRVGVLPQGAPTSPMLSNLMAYKLDQELFSFSLSEKMTYTRYADDIIISSCDKLSLDLIKTIHREVNKIVKHNHFKLNKSKTRVVKKGSRMILLGLGIDGEQPRIMRSRRKKIETFLYSIEHHGWAAAAKFYNFNTKIGFFNYLQGQISYVQSVDKTLGKRYKDQFIRLSELILSPSDMA